MNPKNKDSKESNGTSGTIEVGTKSPEISFPTKLKIGDPTILESFDKDFNYEH